MSELRTAINRSENKVRRVVPLDPGEEGRVRMGSNQYIFSGGRTIAIGAWIDESMPSYSVDYGDMGPSYWPDLKEFRRQIKVFSGANVYYALFNCQLKGFEDRVKPDEGRTSIYSVDTASDTVTLDGDVTPFVGPGDRLTIEGSTGNDGDYTIDDTRVIPVRGGYVTEVAVTGTISDSEADGGGLFDVPWPMVGPSANRRVCATDPQVDRDADESVFIDHWNDCLGGATPDEVFLTVDSSGSMRGFSDVANFDDFVDWVESEYPDAVVNTSEQGDEQWLTWLWDEVFSPLRICTGYETEEAEVLSVDIHSQVFILEGDLSRFIGVGDEITIEDSSTNNGGYTVGDVNVTDDMRTGVTVNQSISSGTADGHAVYRARAMIGEFVLEEIGV